jgi:hypothetical protein
MLASAIARKTATSLKAPVFRSISAWANVPAGPPDAILGESKFNTRRDVLDGGRIGF